MTGFASGKGGVSLRDASAKNAEVEGVNGSGNAVPENKIGGDTKAADYETLVKEYGEDPEMIQAIMESMKDNTGAAATETGSQEPKS